MVRILAGIIGSLCIILGIYFWISEERIGKLQKLNEAYIAKIAQQTETMKEYDARLNLVQDSYQGYQIKIQNIQSDILSSQIQSQKDNLTYEALENSTQATKIVNTRFANRFNALNQATNPEAKK